MISNHFYKECASVCIFLSLWPFCHFITLFRVIGQRILKLTGQKRNWQKLILATMSMIRKLIVVFNVS